MPPDIPASLAQRARLGKLDHLVLKAQPARLVSQVQRGLLALPVRQARQELLGPQVRLGLPERLVPRDKLDRLVLQEQQARPVSQEQLELLA